VVIATTVLFIGSLAAFALVPQQFFPSSDRPELLIDLHLPERASFEATQREAMRMEALLKDRPQIDHWSASSGSVRHASTCRWTSNWPAPTLRSSWSPPSRWKIARPWQSAGGAAAQAVQRRAHA
jgi:multidrug efflux pump subunit AcrB